MSNSEDHQKFFHRDADYVKGFVRGVAWLLYLNPDFDNLPDHLKDFALSEVSKSDSNNI